jgi:hypothetical protein
MDGFEDWQTIFLNRWERDAERRDGSVPDSGDWHLYGDREEDEDD